MSFPDQREDDDPMRQLGTSRTKRTVQQIQQPGGLRQVVRKAITLQQEMLYLVIAEFPDDVKEDMRAKEAKTYS